MSSLSDYPRYRWHLSSLPDQDATDHLVGKLKISPLVAGLLVRRGLVDVQQAGDFLEPRLSALYDPSLMPGCDEAVDRILQAVKDRQPVVIYGDYDVDGVTASAILWHMLKMLGAEVQTYIPHRVDEGYGLNIEAIEQLAAQEPRPLVVTVDCGITAIEPAARAKELGLELIITDHHEQSESRFPCAAILVHPRLPGSQYPFGQLCGAGVALKLAWQLARRHCGSERVSQALRDLLLDSLSLAALGSVADVVPLVDENRLLVRFGLAQIKRTRFKGLNALIEASGLGGENIDSFHVGFVLGPRLNACGRMGHARDALRLLTDVPPEEGPALARLLADANRERQAVERRIFLEAEAEVLKAGFDRPDTRGIVLAGRDWHTGVIGIVASRLVDRFHRPVVMLNCDEDGAHGSARSVLGVSIHKALCEASHLMDSFGGHDMAAGLRLKNEHIDELRRIVVDYVNRQMTEEDLVPRMAVDVACRLAELDIAAVEQLSKLEPFGRANERPRFLIRQVMLDRPAETVGKQSNHLRLHLRQKGEYRKAIFWRAGELAAYLPAGMWIDLVCEARLNHWNGSTSVDLEIKDFQPAPIES